jgi:hypothetical protein
MARDLIAALRSRVVAYHRVDRSGVLVNRALVGAGVLQHRDLAGVVDCRAPMDEHCKNASVEGLR